MCVYPAYTYPHREWQVFVHSVEYCELVENGLYFGVFVICSESNAFLLWVGLMLGFCNKP